MQNISGSIAPNIPIGAIVAYGGDLSHHRLLEWVRDAGWLPCDGTSYRQSDYPELFNAIGTAHGGDASHFNVPDLRNRFLRGTDHHSTNIDPDSASRKEAASGGAVGNNTGSLQSAATGLPRNNWQLLNAGRHSHKLRYAGSGERMTWSGEAHRIARGPAPAQTDSGGAHTHQLTGFDRATQPVNIALYYIIKAVTYNPPLRGIIPGGAIIGFGANVSTPPENWLKCDGAAYEINPNNQWAEGFYSFGGDRRNVFNVPDLRGYFLRGTNRGTGRDPHAAERHALKTGGNTGDNIGSAQFYATSSPKDLSTSADGQHGHSISNVPRWGSPVTQASGGGGYNCIKWQDGQIDLPEQGEHSHTITGGDKETRPENVYTDFLISKESRQGVSLPAGTIMSFGRDTSNVHVRRKLLEEGWLVCDGSLVSSHDFYELYKRIGALHGGDGSKFRLPDLRGYFVMGAGKTRAGTVLKRSVTGAPVNPFIISTEGAHTHTVNHMPTQQHIAMPKGNIELAHHHPNETFTSADGEHTHQVSGGDAESRPINVNVDYIIKFTY